uniref:Secreted protein n=1 Tax=Plectus sambesii TaxID=2011161 RepID=A0A914V1S9_9BILA
MTISTSLLLIVTLFIMLILIITYRIVREMNRLRSRTYPLVASAARSQVVATIDVPKVNTPPPAYETIGNQRRTHTPPPTYSPRPPTGHVLHHASTSNDQRLVVNDLQ